MGDNGICTFMLILVAPRIEIVKKLSNVEIRLWVQLLVCFVVSFNLVGQVIIVVILQGVLRGAV